MTPSSEFSLPSGESTVVASSPRHSSNPMYASSAASSSHSHQQPDSGGQPGLIPLHSLEEEDPGSQRSSSSRVHGYDRADELLPPGRRNVGAVSELSDTSSPDRHERRYSELPADPRGGLGLAAHIPRPSQETTHSNDGHPQSHSHSRTSSQNVVPPLTITTPDGAILQPNLLNNRPNDDDDTGGQRPSHVMSFMEYPPPKASDET